MKGENEMKKLHRYSVIFEEKNIRCSILCCNKKEALKVRNKHVGAVIEKI